MALTVQIIPERHTQRDGRRWVLEIHSDAQGEVARVNYKGRDTDDRNAIAAARLVLLEAQFAEAEVEDAISGDRPPALRFQTAAQFLTRLREMYRAGQSERLVRIARWIRRRISLGDVTENQVRNAFGLTPAQWDTFKAKMQALDESLQLVEEAKGE